MWPHALSALLGIWLMAAPAVLGYGGLAENNDHIVGPLVASFGITAWWQITRGLRWMNVLLGAWLLVSPWVLRYDQAAPLINSLLAGALIAGLSLIQGKLSKPFGGGWRVLLRR